MAQQGPSQTVAGAQQAPASAPANKNAATTGGLSEKKLEQQYSPKNLSPVLQQAGETKARPQDYPRGFTRPSFFRMFSLRFVPPLRLENTSRLGSLILNRKLYLSLHNAILLGIENSLDVEQQRYQLVMADTDMLRAKGGGVIRGLPLTVSQSPVGIGGPGSPLLNTAASAGAVGPTASTVANVFDVNQLTSAQTNLSIQGSTPFSTGPPLPTYDPTLVGQLAWMHLQQEINNGTALIPKLINLNSVNTFGNLTLAQSFSTGTQFLIGSNNASDILNLLASSPDPFRRSNVVGSVTQPLLRGWGRNVNRRYIRIAENNLRVSRLVFRQQLSELIFGISRLYYDLVSLNEDVRVKQETLAAAQALYENDKSQVEVGTLAPLELTRAEALLSACQLDLIRAQGLVLQQEAVIKSVISRAGTADPILRGLRILPTDTIVVPASESLPSLEELIRQGLANRADLAQAALQVANGRINVEGSRNQVKPEIDLIGTIQTRGNLGSTSITSVAAVALPPSAPAGRQSKVYEAGLQVNIPFRNRVAQADLARDEIQLRQMQARLQQLENQTRDEIENALTALEVARSSYTAAVRSRRFQQELLEAEMEKLSVGASTNFMIVQDQSFLAQARSTEVAARSTYIKSRVALERAIGSLVERANVQLDEAIRNEISTPPSSPPMPAEPAK
jgi:outer membrane protein TolC